ncbi:histidine phosphatase family protein [Candidatus Micrarchaeota archaeon]|jgi:broad specificity phosphatase PhoE|nr:histidine phosphatase family protein [Candidatus Micrarchaeota archaeon]
MVLEVRLIRHAESEANASPMNKFIGGRSNWAELTPRGISQAKALGENLRMENVFFKAVFCSPAIRTQQTARYCFEAMGISPNIQLESRIIELDQGDWVGKQREKVYSIPEVRFALDEDCWNFIPGDIIKGESQRAVATRMKEWFNFITGEYSEGIVVAFTHGVAIKCLLANIYHFDKNLAYSIPIDNVSTTQLNCVNGEIDVVLVNDFPLEELPSKFFI